MRTDQQAGAAVPRGGARKMLIGGRWEPAASGAESPVTDPSTGLEIARVPAGKAADTDRAVAAARRAFEGTWQLATPAERGGMLWRLAGLVEEHADELAVTEAVDSGKPLAVARSRDVMLAADVLRCVADWAGSGGAAAGAAMVPEQGMMAYPVLAPAGVVGVVVPWAFPLLMAVWQLAPAIAAGSAVVLKPAEQTPLSALRLGELCQEAGFPDGIVNVVTGPAGAAVRLVTSPAVDRVTFTGCAEVGRQLARAAAADPRKAVLRVGGRAPLVIFRDADIDTAVAEATQAGFFSHFQTCTTGALLYAEKHVYDQVAAGVAEHARKLTAGPALDPASRLGPLVSAGHFRRTRDYLAAALASGADAAIGGGSLEGSGYFIEPTVLTAISPEAIPAATDVTGPVLPVLPFSDLREIATPAGAGTRGGAAGVWTSDVSNARQAAAIVHAGTVWVNSYRIYDVTLPFGKTQHADWGPEILGDYLDRQSVIIQTRKAQ
ncbi:MAG TPA: aldehyde dehydrogenase family protein [Streptosporangiaceae bacterium]|nr:aldehyde dehydrogenase family protein [Streptosporangiaceae bacterium]